MNRLAAIWFIANILGLGVFSQSVFSQQSTSMSAFISTDTSKFVQSEGTSYKKGIHEENTLSSDTIILTKELALPAVDNSYLFIDLYTVTDSLPEKPKWFISTMLEDQGKLWTSPLRIRKKDLKFWLPVLTATALTIIYDEEIYSAIKNFQNNNNWVSEISPVLTWGGENAFVLATGGIFYLSGVISGNKKTSQTGLIALQTWVQAGIIVTVGKMLSGRQRPSYEDGIDKWHGFPASLNKYKEEPYAKYDAFPSGHTIEAWALATIIAQQYKEIKIVPVISYSLATGVGLSRITEDTHWLSDVIMGAALGYSIGKFMVRERQNTKWTLFPKASEKDLIITATYRF